MCVNTWGGVGPSGGSGSILAGVQLGSVESLIGWVGGGLVEADGLLLPPPPNKPPTQFNRKHGGKALACAEDGCKAGVKEVAAALAKRYEDVNAQDQLSRVQGKVDCVREQMQVNITRTCGGFGFGFGFVWRLVCCVLGWGLVRCWGCRSASSLVLTVCVCMCTFTTFTPQRRWRG